MSPNKDETGLSLPKACGMINPFVKLVLASQQTKVQNFVDVFVDTNCNNISNYFTVLFKTSTNTPKTLNVIPYLSRLKVIPYLSHNMFSLLYILYF